MRDTHGNNKKLIAQELIKWIIGLAVSFGLLWLCVTFYGKSVGAGKIEAPTPQRANGVITADEWAEAYPEIVASYKANSQNTYVLDYLEEDPYLKTIYEGFGFAKQYDSARGHEYSLEDLFNTARPHALANCLTCKTADFTKLVQDQGVSAYSLDFEAVKDSMSENIGCYNCHGNEANDNGKLVVTHDYILNTLGSNRSSIDEATLSCGQCHIEYYFEPDTKATNIPYSEVSAMRPEAILEYYDSIGFSDWTQESTGAKLLKAQHPEMETFLGEGSAHVGFGMNCADCHMAKVTENGKTYTSHTLVSPLDSPEILETCAACHKGTDMTQKVQSIQKQITDREKVIGANLAELKEKLVEANGSDAYTQEELDAIRTIYRQAQWYFDFEYVENSEGAHNSKLANSCLDKAESLIADGMKLFK